VERFSQRYLDLIQKKVVEPLAIELRRFAGLTVDAYKERAQSVPLNRL